MATVGSRMTIDGKQYYILKAGVTKAEATRSANWQRIGGFSVRIKKISRGNYLVLTR